MLSEQLLLLAHHGGLSLYAVPAAPPPRSPASSSPPTHAARPLWSRRCDVGPGIYRISPLAWGSLHPLIIAGTRTLHVLRVRSGPSAGVGPGEDNTPHVEYREVSYPFAGAPETDVGCTGLGAVGLRRAIWDCSEVWNGAAHIRFRTYSLPRLDGVAEDGEDEDELGTRGRLGSFSVAVDPAERLVSLCLEECSGRVCLLLNNVTTGARRISIIDAV